MTMHKKLLNDRQDYGWLPIIMHWLIALAVLGLYPLGLYIDSLSYYDPEYRTVPAWHKSIGLLVMAVFVVRIPWRLINKPPMALPQPKLHEIAAKVAHAGLYLLLLITLISGYLISTADGSSIELFNWFSVPALPYAIENQEDIAGEIHFLVATLLISLAALHAGAALKHHFIDKDITLKRMLAIQED